MPTVQWGISRGTLTNYERSSFKPYDGELPPNRIFRWKIRKMVYKAATAESPAQLQMGLELIPRKGRNDERYAGYYLTVFQRITDQASTTGVRFWTLYTSARLPFRLPRLTMRATSAAWASGATMAISSSWVA